MKDPCELCIVKVNCTKICWEKQNLLSLLKNAVAQNQIVSRNRGTSRLRITGSWKSYQLQYSRCLTDVAKIRARAKELKPE